MHLLKKGCLGFLARVWDASVKALSITQIPIVNEFMDVFPDELSRMPSDRAIEFYINLVPDAQFMSISPY